MAYQDLFIEKTVEFLFKITHNTLIYKLQNFSPMTFSELQQKLFENYRTGHVSDAQLVQIFEQISIFLNLKTITNYAKSNKITYNGALKRKLRKIEVDKITFIIDND